MLRAGAYCRKSTQERGKDAEAKSVAVQADEARRYAAKKGWRFVEDAVFQDDAVSGVIADRPGLSALLSAIEGKDRPVDIVIVSEQSRLGRDLALTINLIQRIEDTGVKLFGYLDDRVISLADEYGEMEQAINAIKGSGERRKASQRTRTVAQRMVERG